MANRSLGSLASWSTAAHDGTASMSPGPHWKRVPLITLAPAPR
jgi:hypothetical protein